MGGFAHSILNPINDISNVLVGTKNLFVNPAKQIHKYIEPAVIEAAPAAAAAAMTVLSGGTLAPEAAALAIGSYGGQVATQGIGALTSGKTLSIGDLGIGAAAAVGVGGLQAIGGGFGALTTGGAGAAFGNVGAGLSTIGGVVGGAAHAASGVLGGIGSTLETAAGLGTAAVGLYTADAAYKASQARAAAGQTNSSGYTQAQINQMFQTLMGYSPSQLVGLTSWNTILPMLSSSQQMQIGALFTPQMVAELMAELQDGSITQADYEAIMSVIPQSVQSQGATTYQQATGQTGVGTVATTGVTSLSPAPSPTTSSGYSLIPSAYGATVQPSPTTPSGSPAATQANNKIGEYVLIGGGILVAGTGLYLILKNI